MVANEVLGRSSVVVCSRRSFDEFSRAVRRSVERPVAFERRAGQRRQRPEGQRCREILCSEFAKFRVVVELARVPVSHESFGISGEIHYKVLESVSGRARLRDLSPAFWKRGASFVLRLT